MKLEENGSSQPALRRDAEDPVKQLPHQIDQLEAEVAARDQFLSIATHELRNPLHALAMQITAVQMMATLRGDRAIADRLQKAGKDLQWFLKRSTFLLDVSRIASGLHRLELGTVDLREVIRHVEDVYTPQAQLTETPLLIEFSGDLIGHWDAIALEQVLGNLVSNAIKFGAGSPVLLTAEDHDTDVVKIRVVDRGDGISETDQQRIFRNFREVMLTTDQRKGGFGIGLWLARNLVEAHGGRIRILSTSGSGSAFTILLPRNSHSATPITLVTSASLQDHL